MSKREVPDQLAFASDPYDGHEKRPETIRLGTVEMEQHPDFPRLKQELKAIAKAFGVDEVGVRFASNPEQGVSAQHTEYQRPHYDSSHARAVVRKVIGQDGRQLAGADGIQVEIWLRPGMQYSTVLHELRHLQQLAHTRQQRPALKGTEYEMPLFYTEVWERSSQGVRLMRYERQQGTEGLIQKNEAQVMEVHNLLADLKVRAMSWQPGDDWAEVEVLITELGEEIMYVAPILADWQSTGNDAMDWFNVYFNDPQLPPPGGTWDQLIGMYQEIQLLDEAGFTQWKKSQPSERLAWRRVVSAVWGKMRSVLKGKYDE